MNEGKLQMIDTPINIFNRPANVFTAKFIGAPPCNIVPAHYAGGRLHIGNDSVSLSPVWQALIEKAGTADLVFGLRPEHIELSHESTDGAMRVKILSMENYGDKKGVYFNLGGEEWVAMTSNHDFKTGEAAYFVPDTRKIHIFNSQTTDSIGYPDEWN
jgi:ABC-type sugar transport system ATPase subunit